MSKSSRLYLVWSVIVVVVVLAVLASWWLMKDNGRMLFDWLSVLEAWVDEKPAQTAIVFLLVFALSTALTLPTATVLTITGGFLFGPWLGTGLSVLGALSGACITFIMVRYLAGDTVRSYFSDGKLAGLMRLLERDAFFYLMGLRVVPVAPFFLLNAAAGLIRISLLRFLLATGLGLIPIMAIFASIGAGLETLVEAQDIGMDVFLQPSILLPLLALVGLIIFSAVVRHWMKRRRENLLGPRANN